MSARLPSLVRGDKRLTALPLSSFCGGVVVADGLLEADDRKAGVEIFSAEARVPSTGRDEN